MTTDEKVREVGQLVLDHKEAKRHYECLMAKRDRLIRNAEAITSKLRDGSVQYASEGKFLVDDHVVEWPTEDELARLIVNLLEANRDLQQLEQRRQKMEV